LASSEFEISREQFRRHLGYEPRCIAYPWRLGSEHSLQLARRNGLHAAFGVALDYGAERRATEGMVVFGRLKCDWLRLLPGKRRSSMLATLVRKLSGAGKLQHLAH
jgi:peptidoglycan/xylan/chitin deacetylase (PgdA/CDA1 family)